MYGGIIEIDLVGCWIEVDDVVFVEFCCLVYVVKIIGFDWNWWVGIICIIDDVKVVCVGYDNCLFE